jgi:hypothetical protein
MGFFDSIENNGQKWIWFFCTIIGSFIPIIFRIGLFAFMDHVDAFDFRDWMFAGLAINLSNLSLVGNKSFDRKVGVVIFSVSLIIGFSLVIGANIACTAAKIVMHNVNYFSIAALILTVYVSFKANNYVFKTVI